jgi:tetratricopeptide (TPR) repeat protein
MPKLGRNDPCYCGSGLKYKKCCLSKDEANKVTRIGPSPSSTPEVLIEALEWPNILHQSIALYFARHASGWYDSEQIKGIILIWHLYAHAKLPVTKKLGVYPAALEYVLCQIYDVKMTQSELADKYNVSVSSLSQRANQILEYLMDIAPDWMETSPAAPPRMIVERELAQIHAQLEEQNFDSVEEINDFLQHNLNQETTGRHPLSKSEQAAELLYQAWDEPDSKRRVKMAQEALLLDPDSVDAYNILAESASSSLREIAYYYKMGMEVGEKHFGEAFFQEHKGHFWSYFPTRPYMRAKKGYADACAEAGNFPEAIKHYRELLELNPNDNQGVRDLLLVAYIETSDWNAAASLLRQYGEGDSALFNYCRILVEYSLNGRTPKLDQLIKAATTHNPHVPAYLSGKKRLPRAIPEYIGFGDDREAVYCSQLIRPFWMARPELLKLLPLKR